jgi:FAD/FMN-containing dehydrogenase
MNFVKNGGTTRREFVKDVAVGATGMDASSSLDAIAAAPDATQQPKQQNERGNWVESTAGFKASLAKVVKPESIVSDSCVLKRYSKDCSFIAPGNPLLLVYPEKVEEVQGIVRLANDSRMPLIPVSSGPPRFHGDTVPGQGGVIVDFSRMNRITKIDPINRCAMIEPGVTYGQLIPELKRHGLKINMPLLPRASKSVLTSRLEREANLIPKYQYDYVDPLLTVEVVYGTGDVLRTGSASGPGPLETLKSDEVNPWGPGSIDYFRFLSGAQGTMGLVTRATTKTEVLPSLQKVYFIPIKDLNNLGAPMARLLRQRVVDECLAVNNTTLAAMLAERWPEDFGELRAGLPPWTVIVCIAGYKRRPEERVAIQEKYLKDICEQLGVKPQSTLPAARGKENTILELLTGPWGKEPYWKVRYKGSCHDIFFLTTLSRVPKFIELVKNVVGRCRYPIEDIGSYVQPMAQGRGCHCEFNLFCDESNLKETLETKRLFMDISEILTKNGAFFSRPYGPWAEMVYRRYIEGVTALRKLKGIFDPNNVLNPGKLCF